MKLGLLPFVGLILASAPAQAMNSATLRLVAIVPVSCSLDVVNSTIADGRLTMSVRRNCNTGHRLIVSGADDAALGTLTFRYNDASMVAAQGVGSFAQPEAYYDGIDQLVVESSEGSSDDLTRFAQSLSVSLDTI